MRRRCSPAVTLDAPRSTQLRIDDPLLHQVLEMPQPQIARPEELLLGQSLVAIGRVDLLDPQLQCPARTLAGQQLHQLVAVHPVIAYGRNPGGGSWWYWWRSRKRWPLRSRAG
jgi:hypothetical protein